MHCITIIPQNKAKFSTEILPSKRIIKEFSHEKQWSEKVVKNLKENFVEAWGELKKVL